jgi:hypothetical protein
MSDLVDGQYSFTQLKSEFGKDFLKEKDLCDFLESNIKDFCNDFLEVRYQSHVREYKLVNCSRRSIKGNRRIDFLISTTDGQIIVIECKAPKVLCELSNAVGQCLSYKSLLKNQGVKANRVILMSTKVDNSVPQVITDYNLPIEFMVMDRSRCIKFSHYV